MDHQKNAIAATISKRTGPCPAVGRHSPDAAVIQRLRERRGLTQVELARTAGYCIKTIWKAETGRRLKRQTLTDIAEALGVDFDQVVLAPGADPARPANLHDIVVHEVLEGLKEGDLGPLMAHLSREAILVVPRHLEAMTGTIMRGRHEIEDWLQQCSKRWPSFELEVQRILEDGDFVDVHLSIKRQETQRFRWLKACIFFGFEIGRIASVQIYWNPWYPALRPNAQLGAD